MTEATGARYSIYLNDSSGRRLAVVEAWERLEYALVVNDRSSLVLTMGPGQAIPASAIPDGQIEVWRRLPSGREYLEAERRWLIQKIAYERDGAGLVRVTLEADAPLGMIGAPGRFVAAAAGTSGASKTAAADNLIKAIVREQAGASASAARQIPGLGVAADVGLAPSLSKSFAWKPVLSTLQEVARSSAESGTYLAFDIVAVVGGGWRFETYIGARGTDRRLPSGQSPLILGSAYGNLAEAELSIDYGDEATSCTAGGQGDGTGRLTATYTDSARAAASPLRYREVFVDATSYNTTTGLSAEAQATVRAARPRLVLSGKIQSTRGALYGQDWSWGDYVTVEEFGYTLDARVDAVTVRATPDAEEISAVIRTETYVL